jgi:hypothetical protein
MSAPTRTDLDALAATANVEHHAYETTQAALAHAIAAGDALRKAKELVGQHGTWLAWVREHCDFTERTAQRYMRLAANATRVSDLGTVREALATLADPSAPGLDAPRRPDPTAAGRHA